MSAVKKAILVTTLLLSVCAKAQFRYFTTEDGLQSNTVKCLFQSSDSQIWAGTSKGICRHNGIGFSEYGIENSQSFRSEVLSICESAKDGKIWLGCVDGLYFIDKGTMRIEKDPNVGIGIRCLCLDNDGGLWIGSNGKGIMRYDSSSGTCLGYPECSEGKIISRILMTSDNAVYFCALYDDSIYRYAPGRDEFVRIPIVDRFTKEKASKVADFCQDSYGDIWICDNKCTLFRLHPYDMQFVSYRSTLPMRITDVRVMIEHKKENLVIGTNVGLAGFDCNTMKFYPIDEGNVRNDGRLNDRFIYSLLKDGDSGLWVGTYFGGVNYKSPSCDIVQNIDIPDGCGEIISVMCETDKGNVLIGSDDGGLNKYDFNTRAFRRVVFDAENPNLNIHCIFPDGDDLWIGTYGNGLYRLSRNFSVKKHYESADITLGDLHVYSALRDRSGILWMGTPQGICKYNEESDEFVRALFFDKGNDVTDIIEWEGDIYFASQGMGLIRFRRNSESFEFLTSASDLPKRISTLEVFKSELYLGSFEGLFSYDGVNFTKKGNKRLSESNVASITADNNALWITTTDGLYCYWDDGTVERYGRESGLLSEAFNTNSSIKLSNGEVLVGTERGLSTFKAAALTLDSEQRRVGTVITDFVVLKESGGAKESRSCMEQIIIKSKAASFSIHFSSLNYQKPKSSRFRYKLEGNDKDWTYIEADENHRDATYSSVKPGRYRFKVCATATETSQFGDETSLDIVVKRPLSSIMEIIAGLAFFALAVFYALRFMQRNKATERYLKSVRNTQMEKKLYESMLSEIIEETRNTLARLRITLGAMSDTASTDSKDPNGRIINNNIESLFDIVEKDALKFKAVSCGYGNLTGSDHPKADGGWILQNMLETYKELSANAFKIKMSFTVSNRARSLRGQTDVRTLSSRMREILDECLENASKEIEVNVDSAENCFEVNVVIDGRKSSKKNFKIDISDRDERQDSGRDEPMLNRRFRKDVFNVIVDDAESGFQSGEARAFDTVFNVVVCSGQKEVELGFSNFPVTAFVCGQEAGASYGADALQELKRQYPSTLFITLSSSLHDTSRIEDLGSFADLTLTRPVSLELLAGQIRSLMRLRNTKTEVTDESSILKKIEQTDNFTKSLCEIIKARISDPALSVGDLAKEMNVSRATVFNRLKASLDTTPNNLIRDIRLEIAAQMLTQGNVRVSDVYYKTGFTSASYFSKLFHDRYGISPKDYSK